MSTPEKLKRKSKQDEPMKINTSPEAVVQALFNSKPKQKWCYLTNESASGVFLSFVALMRLLPVF